MRCKFSTTAW